MPVTVTVSGADRARARLERDARRAADWRRYRILIGTPLVYGFGIETGRHRGGRLARAAGGAMMLQQGLAAARASAGAVLRAAGAEAPDRRTLLLLAYRVLDLAKRLTPVRTGTLRRSLLVRETR